MKRKSVPSKKIMSPAPVIVFLTGVRNAINERLEDVEPFQILIFTALSVLLAQQLTNWFVHVRTQIEDKGRFLLVQAFNSMWLH